MNWTESEMLIYVRFGHFGEFIFLKKLSLLLLKAACNLPYDP